MDTPLTRIFSLSALLLSVSACPLSEETRSGGAPLGELVLASVEELVVPGQIPVGAPLRITVRGVHSDGCTVFERFETRRQEALIQLTAWSYRPLGPCPEPGEPFEASTTVEGLPAGVYRVRVNDALEAAVVVAGAGSGPPSCTQAPPLTVDAVLLPPPTFAGGVAEISIEGHLDSYCDRVLEPGVLVSPGRVLIALVAEGCGPLESDPTLCPPGSQPFLRRVTVPFEREGVYSIEVNGTDAGEVLVVPSTECRMGPLPSLSMTAPSRVEAGVGFRITLEGLLENTCDAPNAIVPVVAGDSVTLRAEVHACALTCAPARPPRPARVEIPIDDLPEGLWTLVEESSGVTLPLEVLPAGSCTPIRLPDGSVEQVLLTTEIASLDGIAYQPVDVSIYGTLPAGCWATPSLLASVEGSRIVLTTESTRCAQSCRDAPTRFVSSLALTEGLAPGVYEIVVDGSSFPPFTVR